MSESESQKSIHSRLCRHYCRRRFPPHQDWEKGNEYVVFFVVIAVIIVIVDVDVKTYFGSSVHHNWYV